jgi:hypothetical protein
VQAPSRGLVTRWPTNTADKRAQQDLQRVCVLAENVRFADGVMAAAPGYEQVLLNTSILANCLAHWRLDEASGQRYDAHINGHTLAEDESGGSIYGATGKIGNAAHFEELDTQALVLESGDSSVGNMNGSSFTISGWFKLSTAVPAFNFVSKGTGMHTGDATEYCVGIEGSGVKFAVRNAANSATTVVTSAVVLALDTWYFFCAVHRQGVDIAIRVNATTDTAAHTGGVRGSTGVLTLGPGIDDGEEAFLDSVTIWSRALSSGDQSLLYNSAAGRDYPFTGGKWKKAHQANVLRPTPDPLILGNETSLYLAARTFQSSPRQYQLALTEIYPATSGQSAATASNEFRWSFTDFYDKVIVAQSSVTPQYYLTGSSPDETRVVPGLDVSGGIGEKFDGCESFAGHVILWKDERLKWCDVDDVTNWIPVAETIASMRLTLTDGFTQPAAGATTGWVAVTESPAGLTVGQYVRIDDTQASLPYYNFYTVADVSPAAGLSGTIAPVSSGSNVIAASPGTGILFLTSSVDWEVGQRLVCGLAPSQILTVTEVDLGGGSSFQIDTNAVVAASFTVTITNINTGLRVNDYVSLQEHSTLPGQDIYKITAMATSATQTTLTLAKQSIGSNVAANGATYSAWETYIVKTPWIVVQNSGAAITFDNTTNSAGNRALTEKYAVQLTLEDLTGRTASAASIAASKEIVTLDANSAGELQVVGADQNGKIYQVISFGDYAYVFKERSVSVMQAVGRQSGTFFVRGEVKNEGLIARNSVAKVGRSRVIFLGHTELYDYAGGPTPVPVCTQFTKTLFKELDRAHVEDVFLVHKEEQNEVWVVYPVLGGQKVLVWNYAEDTATIDLYDSVLMGLTTWARVEWSTDPTWDDLPESMTWESVDSTVAWEDMISSGDELVTLLATGDGNLQVHGNVFTRNGDAYTAKAETLDHDFGDDAVYKYVQTVQIALQVLSADTVPRTLYVQVGTRKDLDDTITWGTAQEIDVRGDGNIITKINSGGAPGGRYVRLRFYSIDENVVWRVSSYTIFVRLGNAF